MLSEKSAAKPQSLEIPSNLKYGLNRVLFTLETF